MSIRKTLIRAAGTLAIGLLAVGCNDDSSRSAPHYVTSSYPGSDALRNTSSDDGVAFSQDGADVDPDDFEVWTDSRSQRTILSFIDQEGDLYLSYGSGNGNFTRATNVSWHRQSGLGATDDVVAVIFLNTSGNADAVTSRRNGDALIFIEGDQSADPSNADDQTTDAFFLCYFDVSLVNQSVALVTDVTSNVIEFNNGFQRIASRIDGDPDSSAALGTSNADGGGAVSDSKNGTYGNEGFKFDNRSSGDTTTYVWAVWDQVLSTTTVKELQTKLFPLSTADTYTFGTGNGATLTPSAVDPSTGGNAATMDDLWIATDGFLIARQTGRTDDGVADDDDALFAYVFGTATVSSGVQFTNSDSGETGVDRDIRLNGLALDRLLGPDNGIGHATMIYEESNNDGDPTQQPAITGQNLSESLYLVTIENVGGTPTPSTPMIDEFALLGSDTANVAITNISDATMSVSRDATRVFVTFVQIWTDDDDLAVNYNNTVVKAVGYDTSLQADATAPSPFSNLLVLTDDIDGAFTDNVFDVETQFEMGYVCGISSNVARMTVGFQQYTDTGVGFHRLFFNTMNMVLVAGTTDPVLSSVTSGDVLVADQDASWGNISDFGIFDNGTDGLPIVFFVAQANNSDNQGTTGSYEEERLYAYVQGVSSPDIATETDTNVVSTQGATLDERADVQLQFAATTPTSKSLNTNSPEHAGRYVQVIFEEDREGSGEDALYQIAWDKNVSSMSTPTLITYDTPDRHRGVDVGTNGSSLDVYFLQGDHIHFNTTTGNGGAGTPTIIDNLYSQGLDDSDVDFDDGTSNSCDNGPGAIVGWSKELNNDSDKRFLIRQR